MTTDATESEFRDKVIEILTLIGETMPIGRTETHRVRDLVEKLRLLHQPEHRDVN